MNRAVTLFAILALSSTPSFAALSGFYDSAEQINTIMANEDVANALRQAPIGSISNTGTRDDGAHEWTIQSQECDLTAYLIAVPPAGVGKTTYKVDLTDTCE